MPIRVDRCVCTETTFASLLAKAQASGMSYEALTQATGACLACGMCGPYVRKTLETGQVVFHQILPADDSSNSQG